MGARSTGHSLFSSVWFCVQWKVHQLILKQREQSRKPHITALVWTDEWMLPWLHDSVQTDVNNKRASTMKSNLLSFLRMWRASLSATECWKSKSLVTTATWKNHRGHTQHYRARWRHPVNVFITYKLHAAGFQ